MRYLGNFIAASQQAEWVEAACLFIEDHILEVLNNKSRCQIAISGGTTPGIIFEALINNHSRLQDHWASVDFFWVDERLVPLDSSESNAGNALRILGQLPSRFFPMFSADLGSQESLKQYQEHLSLLPVRNELPVFDLILLGMGDDGHTASLFPATAGLGNRTDQVIINEVPQLQSKRMTLTFPVINNAREILILFNGGNKIKLIQEIIFQKTAYPVEYLLEAPTDKTWIYYC